MALWVPMFPKLMMTSTLLYVLLASESWRACYGLATRRTVNVFSDEELHRAMMDTDTLHIRLCSNISMSLDRWSTHIVIDRELLITGEGGDALVWSVPFIPYSAVRCAANCQLTIRGPFTLVQNLTRIGGNDSIGFTPIFLYYPIGGEGRLQLADHKVVIDRPDAIFNHRSAQYRPENAWWTDDIHLRCIDNTSLYLSDWHVTSEKWTRIWYNDPHRAMPPSRGFVHMHNLTVVLDTVMDLKLLRPDVYCHLLEQRNARQLLTEHKESDHQKNLWWVSLVVVLPLGLLVLVTWLYKRRQGRPIDELGIMPTVKTMGPQVGEVPLSTNGLMEGMKGINAVSSDGKDHSTGSGLLVLSGHPSDNLSTTTPWYGGLQLESSALATEGTRADTPHHTADSFQAVCSSHWQADAVQLPDQQHSPTDGAGGQGQVVFGDSGSASDRLGLSPPCAAGVPQIPGDAGGQGTSLKAAGRSQMPSPMGPNGLGETSPQLHSPLLPSAPYPLFHMPTAFRDQRILSAIQSNPFDCEVVRYLGAGGNGVVYQAVWKGNTVALKVILHRVDLGVAGKARALAEAMLGRRLRHPNLVATLEYAVVNPGQMSDLSSAGSEDVMTETYIMMEFCDRGTLRSMRSSSWAPLDTGYPLAVHLLLEVARAVQYLHANEVVHGDLKASNVLLNHRPTVPWGLEVKVGDFGISRMLQEVDGSHITLSRPVGTLTHMAPEMLQGKALSMAADVYAFGVVLYEVITGQSAFHGVPCASVVFIVTQRQIKDVLKFPAGCNVQLVQLAHRCWSKNPKDRPSMDEVEEQLLQIQREASS